MAATLSGLLDGMKFPGIPGVPEFTDSADDGFRKAVNEAMVQPQVERGPTEVCQRNIVARQIHTLESVDFLELHDPVPLLFSVRKTLVNKI
jgi:hypothetical protein